MLKPTQVTALLFAVLSSLCCGCSATHRPDEPTHIELGGTPGAQVRGYYVRDGRRVSFDAALPTTLPPHGVSQFVVSKVNPGDELKVRVSGPDGSLSHGLPPGTGNGMHVQVAGGLSVSDISGGEARAGTQNALMVIAPYWYEGTWVFDDHAVGLEREPFVAGVPEMINHLVKDMPDARSGFRLTFSEKPFPGFQQKLAWVRLNRAAITTG